MVLCMIVYIILIFLLLEKRRFFPQWDKKTKRQIWSVLFCANTIACCLFFVDGNSGKTIAQVKRNHYGEGSRRETYEVTVGDEVEKEEITIDIEEQKYTKEEIQEIFRKVTAEIEEVILGENKSLDYVEQDLNLLTEWKEYPIQIQWELDRYDVINEQGEIQQEKTKAEGTLVELTATLRYESEEALYVTNVMVYPKKKSQEEKLLSGIQGLVAKNQEKTETEKTFPLPAKIDGKQIFWNKKVEQRGYYVLGLGGVGAVLLLALKKQKELEKEKIRKDQMLTDYPEIIHKFTLLFATGMTTKAVWERIVKNYEEKKADTGERVAYEEMRYTANEMQSGITEAEAYERFGKRCGLPEYMKFGALLSQNLKKGTKGMTDLLRNESFQAFENRKSRAKRKGEEAGTKLLAPMFGMLAVVLIIVIVPAFLSMQL